MTFAHELYGNVYMYVTCFKMPVLSFLHCHIFGQRKKIFAMIYKVTQESLSKKGKTEVGHQHSVNIF